MFCQNNYAEHDMCENVIFIHFYSLFKLLFHSTAYIFNFSQKCVNSKKRFEGIDVRVCLDPIASSFRLHSAEHRLVFFLKAFRGSFSSL